MILVGHPVDFLSAFLGGIGISFTPCVFPLIPVTAGYIGARGAGSRLKGFLLSITYVTGIAVTYAVLGLLASLTGKLFGTVSSHPATYIVVGSVIIAFGISMWGFFDIQLPAIFRLPRFEKKNYLSALVLGLCSGLLIGPCMTPALGAILVYLTTTHNLLYGTLLLVCFAYGMGAGLVAVGTFSSIAAGMPKAGAWMTVVKKVAGTILFVMGAYFIYQGIRRF